mmetsp:Transcript_19959/g.37508  ORF Transcript_19959/g.37508 Transcript_19959/m.37508 type:complete len:413 (-) Transcript_19959:250-1488(-)
MYAKFPYVGAVDTRNKARKLNSKYAYARCSLRWRSTLSQSSGNLINVIRGSDENGAALVNLLRFKVQNTLSRSSDGFTTRLLEDERHRSAFVQKTELSIRILSVSRVSEDPSIQESTVDIADHRTDVTRAVLGATLALALLKIVNVGLKLRVPVEVVGLVHRVDLTTLRDLDVGVGKDELSNSRVKSEAVQAVSGGDHKDGRRRVHAVPRGNQVLSRLQSGFQAILLGNGELITITDNAFLRGLEDTEDGSGGDGSIDVRGSVKGVEGGHIFSRVELVNNNWIVFLLRSDNAKLSGGAKGSLKDIVGDDIELLLLLALHVDRSTSFSKTSGTGNTGSLNHGGNALASHGDSGDEANHVLLSRSPAAHGLLDHEAGESHSSIIDNSSGRSGLGGLLGHNPRGDAASGIPATSH